MDYKIKLPEANSIFPSLSHSISSIALLISSSLLRLGLPVVYLHRSPSPSRVTIYHLYACCKPHSVRPTLLDEVTLQAFGPCLCYYTKS